MAVYTKALSKNSNYVLELEVTYGNYNIQNNTTPVSWILRVRKLAGTGYWSNNATTYLRIIGTANSGTKTLSSFNFENYTVLTLDSGSTTVTHEADGSKSIRVYGNWNSISNLGSATIDTTMELPKIPRASKFTVTGTAETGATQKVNITKVVSDYRHDVHYRVGSGAWKLVVSNTTASVVDLVVPHSAFPTTSRGEITVKVTTKPTTTTTAGSGTVKRTITVPPSVLPSFSDIVTKEVGDHASKLNLYPNFVQHISKVKLTMLNSKPGSGATIVDRGITLQGEYPIYGPEGTTGVLKKAGTLMLSGSIADSRNRSINEIKRNVIVEPYNLPGIANQALGLQVQRCNSYGELDKSGDHIKIDVSASYTVLDAVAFNHFNKMTMVIKSKKRGAQGYTTIKTEEYGYVFGGKGAVKETYILSGYQQDYAYDFLFEFTDEFNTTRNMATVSQGTVTQHWGEDSVSVGMMLPGTDRNLYVGPKGMKTEGPMYDKNNVEIIGNATYDNKDNRATNNTPEWYMTKYPKLKVSEFKTLAALNLKNRANGTYCELVTSVRYYDPSGGQVVQTAYTDGDGYFISGQVFTRSGSGKHWGNWSLLGGGGAGVWQGVSTRFPAYYERQYPEAKRTGDTVTLVGELKPHADSDMGVSSETLAKNLAMTLPPDMRPHMMHRFILQGSGTAVWLMVINTDGNIYFSRYRTGTAVTKPPTTAWLPFSVTFQI